MLSLLYRISPFEESPRERNMREGDVLNQQVNLTLDWH